MRASECTNSTQFDARVGKWLLLREAENSYLLAQLQASLNQRVQCGNGHDGNRFFIVEEGEQLLCAGILFGGGCLCITWATDEITDVLAEHLAGLKCGVSSVFGPSHAAWSFARKWAELTGQRYEIGRAERVYQMVRCTYQPPLTGRLEVATEADRELILPWVAGFMREAEFELSTGVTAATATDELIHERVLFLWKEQTAVSMAAWLSPTPNGGCINFVYTPEHHRGKGYAKAVTAALAQRQLAQGRKYCFIMTDNEDKRTNHLYQAIGARTLCELLRCTLHAKQSGGLNVHPSGMIFANG